MIVTAVMTGRMWKETEPEAGHGGAAVSEAAAGDG